MLGSIFENVKITGMACSVPDNIVYTEEYANIFGEKEVQRFIKTTGIKSRYLAKEKQCASDLCYVSAKKLMEHKGYTPDDIDALIYITQSPDYAGPATAFVLQKRLELNKNCVVFDINLGCSAFPNGVFTVASMIKSGAIKRALLLVGDVRIDTQHIEHNIMLFGDVGAACIMEAGDDTIRVGISSEGENFQSILQAAPNGTGRFGLSRENVPKYEFPVDKCYLDGEEIFIFSISSVPKLMKEFLKEYELSVDDFDYFAFHQANSIIINHIARKMKISMEKVPVSIDKYANTCGASSLLSIVDLCQTEENVPDKLKIMLTAFGVGLSIGTVSFEMDKKDILPLIYTNDYYEEGYLKDFFENLKENNAETDED